jgi:Rieske Fe-S protein
MLNRRKMLALLMGGTSVAAVGLSLGLYGLQSMSNGAQLAPAMTNVNMPATGKGKGNKKNVIGSKQQAVNTAQQFINPHDGKESLLIHLPNGTFVAYERACTHVGVQVNYDTDQHLLVCPAHGSIFDPLQAGRVVQGPAMQPLPQVTVHMNADGTVTI